VFSNSKFQTEIFKLDFFKQLGNNSSPEDSRTQTPSASKMSRPTTPPGNIAIKKRVKKSYSIEPGYPSVL